MLAEQEELKSNILRFCADLRVVSRIVRAGAAAVGSRPGQAVGAVRAHAGNSVRTSAHSCGTLGCPLPPSANRMVCEECVRIDVITGHAIVSEITIGSQSSMLLRAG
jgi:hypothetical protein